MKFKSKLIKDNSHSIFKNMAILATGTGIAKIIGLISIPIVTRIYSPEQFGLLSLFLATTMTLMPFSTMTYSMSIPLPKKDALAINMVFLSVMILTLMCTLFGFTFYFFSDVIFRLFDLRSLINYWWLIPLFILCLGAYEILKNIAIRKKDFKSIIRSQICLSLTDPIVKIGLGFVGVKPLGLLLGVIIAQLIGIVVLLFRLLKSIKSDFLEISIKRTIFLLHNYSEYPKFRLPSQFLLIFSRQSILIFSAMYFGKDITGQLGLAFLAIGLPLQLFGQTTGKAYYGEIAKIGKNNPELIYYLTKKVMKRLFFFSLIPFVVLFVGSPMLFSMVFGTEWYKAGVFTSILSLCMLVAFVSAPISNVLNVYNKQIIYLRLNIVRALLIVCLFFFIWKFRLNPFESVFSYSILLSIYFIWMIKYILDFIKNKVNIINN